MFACIYSGYQAPLFMARADPAAAVSWWLRKIAQYVTRPGLGCLPGLFFTGPSEKGNREILYLHVGERNPRTATESWARATVLAPAGRTDARPCRGAGGGGRGALSRWWGHCRRRRRRAGAAADGGLPWIAPGEGRARGGRAGARQVAGRVNRLIGQPARPQTHRQLLLEPVGRATRLRWCAPPSTHRMEPMHCRPPGGPPQRACTAAAPGAPLVV